MIYRCKAQRSLLLSCSRHWDNCGFFTENCTVGGQFSRMSHTQSGESVIPVGIAQNVPQHWLDRTVWDWDSDTRGLNGRAESIEVVSWEGCTAPGSFPRDKECLYKCCVKYYHITRNLKEEENSPPVLAAMWIFSLFFCSFKTLKREGWWCDGNGLSSGASDSNIHFIL